MKKIKSWEVIAKTGEKVQMIWREVAKQNNIQIDIQGISAISSYTFKNKNSLKYKTFVTQEMLKNGILASTFFAATTHTQANIDEYAEKLNNVFSIISKCQKVSLKLIVYLRVLYAMVDLKD